MPVCAYLRTYVLYTSLRARGGARTQDRPGGWGKLAFRAWFAREMRGRPSARGAVSVLAARSLVHERSIGRGGFFLVDSNLTSERIKRVL